MRSDTSTIGIWFLLSTPFVATLITMVVVKCNADPNEQPLPAPAPPVECPVDLRVLFYEQMMFERKMDIDSVWSKCTVNTKQRRVNCMGETDTNEVMYVCTEEGCEWFGEGKKP